MEGAAPSAPVSLGVAGHDRFGFCRCAAHPAKAKSRIVPNRLHAVSKSVVNGNFEYSAKRLTSPAPLALVGPGQFVSLLTLWPNNTVRPKIERKRLILAAIFLSTVGGCATTAAGPAIAGSYAPNPIPGDQDSDASHRGTRDYTLTLYEDGTYVAGWWLYFDGKRILTMMFSGLEPYDLQTNSRGSWRIADGKLILRSVGPAHSVTETTRRQSVRSIHPEESQADLFLRNGRWVVVWKDIEYPSRQETPNKSADSTASAGTSAAGQPRVPPSAASHL
jgi:hypothetical protein